MKSKIIIMLFPVLTLVCAAQTTCDPDLVRETNSADRDSYSPRGDRCEGVYLQQVAATVGDMLVASLTAPVWRPAQWPQSGALTLRWNQYSGGGDVHVQAFPLVPRKYFRLDVVKSTAAYDWNTDLVAKYLAPSEAGLVAWTTAQINGHKQRVYLPIAVSPSDAPKGPYHLALVPPVELSEVYLTVARIEPGEKPLKDRSPLKFGSYPANQKIDFDLPPLPKTGLYRVELVGDRRTQGSVTTGPFPINHSQ